MKERSKNIAFLGGVHSLGEHRPRGSILEQPLAEPKLAASKHVTDRIDLSADGTCPFFRAMI
jgi:hypothetical protein